MSQEKNNEILIAVIGALAVIATAVFSNWEKFSNDKEEIRASYTGYKSTGNLDAELRYFFEVIGMRMAFDSMQKEIEKKFKNDLISAHPDDHEKIGSLLTNFSREAISPDDLIGDLVQVYRKFYTIEEIQELNKFYSTEVMQNNLKKIPLIAPEMVKIRTNYAHKTRKRLQELIDGVEFKEK
jgi:hypothetical protein